MCILPDSQSSSSRELSELVCAAGERGRSARTTLWRVRVNQALNGWAPFGRPRYICFSGWTRNTLFENCESLNKYITSMNKLKAQHPRQQGASEYGSDGAYVDFLSEI